MKKNVKTLTALLVASASIVALGGTIHANNNVNHHVSVVKANAASVQYTVSENGQLVSKDANSLAEAINNVSLGSQIYVTNIDEVIDTPISIDGKELQIYFYGDCKLKPGSSLSNGTAMFNVTNGASVNFIAVDTLTIGSESSNAKFMSASGSHVNLTGDIIVQNFKNSVNGGAIYVENSTVVFNGVSIINCQGYQGGALYAKTSECTIDNCDISYNNATSTKTFSGAGLVFEDSTATISGTVISHNTGVHGVGLVVTGTSSDVTLKSGTSIDSNETTAWGGAGLLVFQGLCTMENGASVTNNVAAQGGAGVLISQPSATFHMKGGEISGNTAHFKSQQGGAAVLLSQPGAKFIMDGGVIKDNYCDYGAAVISETQANVELNGGEISNNTNAAGTDADMYFVGNQPTVNIQNYVKDLSTKANLSFGYSKDDEDNYSFYVNSNGERHNGYIGLRFAAMIPMAKWNVIKNNVTKIGIAYANEESFSQPRYSEKDASSVVYVNEDGTETGNAYAAYSIRIMVPQEKWSSQMYYGIGYVTEKGTDTKYYLGGDMNSNVQSYSVKTLSQKYIDMKDDLGISGDTLEALSYLAR